MGDEVGVNFFYKHIDEAGMVFAGARNSRLIKSLKQDHPSQRYFVSVHSFGFADMTLNDKPVLAEVGELAPGRNLQSYENSTDVDFPAIFKACPCNLALHVLRQVFEAVLFLWEGGLELPDIQPANIMMNSKGDVKLVDYDWMIDLLHRNIGEH